MRHVKMFNEMNSEISNQDIKDICLELEDLGYTIKMEGFGNSSNPVNSNYVKIRCNKIIHYNGLSGLTDLKWNEIKDCFLRLKDYLGDRYVQFFYYSNNKSKMGHVHHEDTGRFHRIILNDNTNLDNFHDVGIIYKNDKIKY